MPKIRKRKPTDLRKTKSATAMNWKEEGQTGDETALFTVYLQKFDKGEVLLKQT